jgi:hypothetical protein
MDTLKETEVEVRLVSCDGKHGGLMIRVRALGLIAALLGAGSTLAAVNEANADEQASSFAPVSSTPFYFFHYPPAYAAWTTVGYKDGVYNGRTNVQSATSGAGTYYLRAYANCNTPWGGWTASNWTAVSTSGVWVSSPTCASKYGVFSSISQGAVGISH